MANLVPIFLPTLKGLIDQMVQGVKHSFSVYSVSKLVQNVK